MRRVIVALVPAVALALGTFSAPLALDAQQPGKVPRIGVLLPGSASDDSTALEAFRKGLRERGYVEGQSLIVEWRYAEGKLERLPALAAELVRLKMDVIVTASTPGAQAAKQATSTIPIVVATSGDPVGTGLVASLSRPGGNVTGLTHLAGLEIFGKRLELLKEVIPTVSRVAVLWNSTNPPEAAALRELQGAAQSFRVTLLPKDVRSSGEFETAFTAMTRERPDALLVIESALTFRHRGVIVDFATRQRLPTVFGDEDAAKAGGLLSYATSFPDLFRRAAVYVDKILKGARPADLPVEQPTRFELVINLKTAKALGLTIPQSILIRADHVIQ